MSLREQKCEPLDHAMAPSSPQVGQKLMVVVETVFEGGMVVCYHNKLSNTVVRGALLGTTAAA